MSVAVDLRSNNHERKESVNFKCFLCSQACRENHVDVVELLLDYGASVNAPFPNSRLVKEVSQICFSLNTERSYKRQGHATLKHFVGFFMQWWKAEITVT